jgi:acetyl-CoA acetyltransferase
MNGGDFAKRWVHSGEPYAAWMRRYMHDFGVNKDAFAYMAMNNRSHGARNPAAVMQQPLSYDDYHSSRMIWEPMQILDMDVPVDCAEAHVITTAERARDLPHKPVYIHAMALGGTRCGEFYENTLPWTELAHWVAAKGMLDRSDIRPPEVDLFYPYDGYTIDAVCTVEASGWCKPGETGDFLKESWDPVEGILKLNGRTQVSTHGGGLALGRAGGSNFYSEAVRQLRGAEGARQVADAKSALINIGSFFHDPAAVMLRAE